MVDAQQIDTKYWQNEDVYIGTPVQITTCMLYAIYR